MASKANTFVASFVAAAALACIDVGSIQSQRLPDAGGQRPLPDAGGSQDAMCTPCSLSQCTSPPDDDPNLVALVASTPPSALPNGEEVMVAKEMAARIDRALTGISEPQRAALRLVKGEGLCVTQAAAALRTTTTGVRLRTHRALRAVSAELTVTMGGAA